MPPSDGEIMIEEMMPDSMTNPLLLFDIAKAAGRPLYSSAPMVRYSKLAFRQTVYDYGVDLCWTPMILAKEFNRSSFARDSDFTVSLSNPAIPTIIQFGASSPLEFSRASSLAAPYVSGVDLNCGCPQSWACAESLGAALMNRREVVAEMVTEARKTLERDGYGDARTISVKIRVHKDLRQTIDFIQTVQEAGVSFLTIHGRNRYQRSSEPVSLEAIGILASHCTVPVIANGDVTTLRDAYEIAKVTGVDGVMSARALLENPALFKGYDSCPWEAVEKLMNYVAKAPIPFKLVMHHMMEMCCSGGHGPEGSNGVSGALLSKKEKAELVACRNMLELIDWLDGVRELRRF